jgi:hypothetical protein
LLYTLAGWPSFSFCLSGDRRGCPSFPSVGKLGTTEFSSGTSNHFPNFHLRLLLLVYQHDTSLSVRIMKVVTSAEPAQKPARKALLNRLHHLRRIATLRFTQQQVQVLGHDHIPGHYKAIPSPDTSKNFQQQVAMLRLSE